MANPARLFGLAVLGLMLCAAGSARAEAIVSLTGTSFSGGLYHYNYSVILDAGDVFRGGDFLTFFDPTSGTTGATQPGFTYSTQNTGKDPSSGSMPFADDPTIANISATRNTFTGSDISGATTFAIITLNSAVAPDPSNLVDYAIQDSTGGYYGTVEGPGTASPLSVPEPSSLALVGIGGMAGLVVAGIRRGRRRD